MGAEELNEPAWGPRQRHRRSIVVVDVVESVRLMQENEADVIDRWLRLVNEVRTQTLALHGGRLVKSLGDGLLLEFESVLPAMQAAMDIHQRAAAVNVRCGPERAILLRAGVHVSEVVVDELDVFGAGVNLAARLATLAGPGEIVLSAQARDEVVDSFEFELEDMGECWLKNLSVPQRAFKAKPASEARTSPPPPPQFDVADAMTPTIAVVPLQAAGPDPDANLYGELIADVVIGSLARSPGLRVISRLSTSKLKGHPRIDEAARDHLHATFVLAGTCMVVGARLMLLLELSDTRDMRVLWADRFDVDKNDLSKLVDETGPEIAATALLALVQAEMARIRTQPFPNLESFSLLIGSISLLHRASSGDFLLAREALDALTERVPKHAIGHAWKAKWHFLRLIRGLSPAAAEDRQRARQASEQAVNCDPNNSLALTYRGLVLGFLEQDLAAADRLYESALAINPNEAMAWLFTCTLRSWQGRGPEAAAAAERALSLSPIDPLRYYYDSLAAAGMLADGQYARAIELCRRSLRANRLHTATHRVMAIAQVMTGDTESARHTVTEMMQLEPQLTAARYIERYPGREAPHAQQYVAALIEAGLPK